MSVLTALKFFLCETGQLPAMVVSRRDSAWPRACGHDAPAPVTSTMSMHAVLLQARF